MGSLDERLGKCNRLDQCSADAEQRRKSCVNADMLSECVSLKAVRTY